MPARATPIAQKIAKGTYRKHRHENIPRIAPALPDCPSYLCARARYWWKKVGAELLAAGIITRLDQHALAVYVDAVARFEEITQQLPSVDGFFSESKNRETRLFAVRNKIWDQLVKSGQELGLSPVSRNKVRKADGSIEDLGGWGEL